MTRIPISVDSNLLRHTLLVTFLLILKFMCCLLLQGKARILAGSRPPEDQSLFPKAGAQNFDGVGKFKDDDVKGRKRKESESRWLRLIQNDLENLPLGLIVAWSSLLCDPNVTAQMVLLWTFCIGRVAHSYAYANAMQPMRVITWLTGIVGMVGMLTNGLLAMMYL